MRTLRSPFRRAMGARPLLPSRRVAFTWGGFACTIAAAGFAYVGVHIANAEIHADFLPPKVHPERPASGPLARAESVVFRSEPNNCISGWWVQGGDAALVFLHGTAANKSQLVPTAEVLGPLGYGMLLYDSPGHGDSTGRVTWSHDELGALRSALSFAQTRGAKRLGVVGFSSGSMIAVHEASSDPRVKALVLLGAFENLDAAVEEEFGHLGPLTRLPALWGTRWAGFRPNALGALGAPQTSTLLIAGDRDRDVPLELSEKLYLHLSGPKELWVVAGAAHGEYQTVAGSEYARRLTAFLQRALPAER